MEKQTTTHVHLSKHACWVHRKQTQGRDKAQTTKIFNNEHTNVESKESEEKKREREKKAFTEVNEQQSLKKGQNYRPRTIVYAFLVY